MRIDRMDIRMALPSKGRLAEATLTFLAQAGLRVHKPNPRQFEATIPGLPGLSVLFQRAGDILISVRDGSIDFGITGWDVVSELGGQSREILTLHKELGFGHCTLNVIIPERLASIRSMADLAKLPIKLERPLRVVTKYPQVTDAFLRRHGLEGIRLIEAEGTLEVAPTIGYADLIVDLVSTGTTLRDNRLITLEDGVILSSQACLIANRRSLQCRSEVLAMAHQLLEFIVAHLRAATNVAVFANIRGDSPQAIAERMFGQDVIAGLQGPTISPVITRQNGGWYAVHIIVRQDQLF